jgi:hypothetical protein
MKSQSRETQSGLMKIKARAWQQLWDKNNNKMKSILKYKK